MIFDVSGKRIVFGMLWETRLSEGDVHTKARAAKSPYVWAQEKAFYYGVLSESDRKGKLGKSLYAGAVILQHRYPDVQNLMLVLEIPGGAGYIACGLHQGRPRNGCDLVVKDWAAVETLLTEFKKVCGGGSFKIYGDVHIGGIEPVSIADIVDSIDSTAQMRRVKSALVNPLAFAATGTAAVLVAFYGIHVYTQYRHAEAQRQAMAAQKSSQSIYDEELRARRKDAAMLAHSVSEMIAPIRGLSMSIGGWPLAKATCNVPVEKQVVCTYEYTRRDDSQATNKTFMDAAGKAFDGIDMAGNTIKATKAYKAMAFIEQGNAIDAAKTKRDEAIEFGSSLQRLSAVGKPKLEDHLPFALPPTAIAGELTSQPIGAARWEFTGPVRSLQGFQDFPAYATISKVVITFTDKPAYGRKESMAMATVNGTIFSKPN